MRLAMFNDHRLGVVSTDGSNLWDVTAAVPDWEPGTLGAGWWVRLCGEFESRRPALEAAVTSGAPLPLDSVTLCAPVLNPSKVLACAANYPAHRTEMAKRRERLGITRRGSGFDVFLKAPSAISGPQSDVELSQALADQEVHHECELALVIGNGGADIAESDAMGHVLGYLIGLDLTLRGEGDRSRRKSYDTFCPLGPWLTTADEVDDPHDLSILLRVQGEDRQVASTSDLVQRIPGIIAYASSVMTLVPGDVILTGSPHGVGAIKPDETLTAEITGLGRMSLRVSRRAAPAGERAVSSEATGAA